MPPTPDHALQTAVVVALFSFAGALLTLAGVLYNTRTNVRLGNRTEDRNSQGQQVTQQQQLINSMIEGAKATPELVMQLRTLITDNAGFQTTILLRDRTIDDLTQDIAEFKAAFQRLETKCEQLTTMAERVPQLEATVASQQTQLALQQGELEQVKRERDDALRGKQAAEEARRLADAALCKVQFISENACAAQEGHTS